MKHLRDYIKEQLHTYLCNDYKYIDEGGGIYDGQIELSQFIVKKIYDTYYEKNNNNFEFEITYNDVKNIKNVCFNTLVISIREGDPSKIKANTELYQKTIEDDSEYLKYNYDQKTHRLDFIKITILCNLYNNDQTDERLLKSRISHELNHAYTYWNIVNDDFNNDQLYNTILKSFHNKYHNILHKYADECYNKITEIFGNDKSLLSKYSKHLTFNQIQKIHKIYMLLYILTRYECNAFLAEIITYISDNDSKLSNPNNVENKLIRCPQYTLYTVETPNLINEIENEWSEYEQRFLTNAYEYVYGRKLTPNRIIKIIRNKIRIIIDKLNKNISYLSNKYYNESFNKGSFIVDKNIPANISFNNIHINIEIDWF